MEEIKHVMFLEANHADDRDDDDDENETEKETDKGKSNGEKKEISCTPKSSKQQKNSQIQSIQASN